MPVPAIDYPARLRQVIAELQDGALLVLSQPTALRNSTTEHAWRQESFFHWLTGFNEPEAAILITPTRAEGDRVHLFLREKNPERELWDGRRLGITAAKATLAIDQAYNIESLWQKVPDLLGASSRVHYHLGLSPDYDREFIAALAAHRRAYGKRHSACQLPVHDALAVAGRLRLRKDAAEISRLRLAADITRQTYAQVFATVRPGLSERDVHGLLLGAFLRHGGEMEAYGSIVAAGANACVLHYRDNNQPLKDGDLLLIDAGAQAEYYACDVTRTFPIGSRFSPEQKAVYEIVLAAQAAAIAQAKTGSTLTAVHDAAVAVLTDGMIALKLLSGSRDEIIAKELYKRYYPHGTSHWIGMDVHDVGIYSHAGKPINLASGMYFSVEPGLYIAPDDSQAPPAFRGIGVRIEDDVLITEGGTEVLTDGIAKATAALENRG